MNSFFLSNRLVLIGLCHLGIIVTSLVAASMLRFDFFIPATELLLLQQVLWIAVLLKLLVFHVARLHKGWWRFVGMTDLLHIFCANLVASVCFTAAVLFLVGSRFPRPIYFVDFLLCFLLTAGARFAVRLYNEAVQADLSHPTGKGLLIYGAGIAGMMLLREIRSNPGLGYQVIGFLDDDPRKKNTDLMGVPVLGRGRNVAAVVDRYRTRAPRVEEIVIAMPSASGRQMQEALANCRVTGVACKTIPGLGELLNGKVLSAQIRNVSPNDLLGRDAVRLEEDRIRKHIMGRSVMVTGAAGSIGAELCRQIAHHRPNRLVPFDQAESDLFKIDLELRTRCPDIELVAEVGDIRDAGRLQEVIRRHSIDSIFHAAAYKHVPMMEAHLFEAVKNNVLGTWNVAQAAYQNGVSNFLMISSDKAVNPSNIMGMTKRAAELIVSAMQTNGNGHGTQFVSVRFGNVLGSNGSVVPLFQAQIAGGGPVTVTHPEVRRYFMTVREAVQLVLQASTMGKGTEIFVLDMGEPIRIVDLARNMIRMAGLVPEEDIEIRFIGLRPGEKLYEELMTQGENILPTYHEKIKIFQGHSLDRDFIEQWIFALEDLLALRDKGGVVEHLKTLVPEYRPASASLRLNYASENQVQAATAS